MNKNNKFTQILKVLFITLIVFIISGCGFKENIKNNNDNSGNIEENITNENSDGVTIDKNTDININKNYNANDPFLMEIESVFTISNVGTAVHGNITRGTIRVGDSVQIVGMNSKSMDSTVLGLQLFRKEYETASIGDDITIILKDIDREDLKIGQVVTKPNSIAIASKFDAKVYVYSKEEGGRHTPFYSNFRPKFIFRTNEIFGIITLSKEVEKAMPGEIVTFTVELENTTAIEIGMEFIVSEDSRNIAKGKITKIY